MVGFGEGKEVRAILWSEMVGSKTKWRFSNGGGSGQEEKTERGRARCDEGCEQRKRERGKDFGQRHIMKPENQCQFRLVMNQDKDSRTEIPCHKAYSG